jgi:hypothetical protein
LTLNLKKYSFAKLEVKFPGHVVGSGGHRPDEDKLPSVACLSRPDTKREVRWTLGVFLIFVLTFIMLLNSRASYQI